jgi:aryl-alcohol dehydrogenase-like predicted oxidoreductase
MAEQLDHFRLLGRSGLRVSPLALGTMTFGVAQGWGSEDAEAEKIFKHYLEQGGNSIDTANFYGNGGSERLLDLVRAGKTLYVGLSDTPAWQASRMQAIAELRGWSPLIALQIPYNLTERTVERDLIPMALEMGMGVLPWSPLAGGVLSGKYDQRDLTAATAPRPMRFDSRKDINLSTGRLNQHNLAIAAVVGTIAQEMNRTSSQVALAWTRLNTAVVSPIIGARTLAQLKDNLLSLEVSFSAEQIARLEAASRIDMGFPHTLLANVTGNFMFGGVKVAAR